MSDAAPTSFLRWLYAGAAAPMLEEARVAGASSRQYPAMAVKHDIELSAAAAAAHVLGAKLIRRDIDGAQLTRDFDLVLRDHSREPLEVTRHVDQLAYQTWERIRPGRLPALSLKRVWAVGVPSSMPIAGGGRAPYDVCKLQRELEGALAELEMAGHTAVELGRLQRELPTAFATLVDLRIQGGLSRTPEPGESPHISIGAAVGGVTMPDLIAAAIEIEASDPGNRAKLAQPVNASRRHLFVVFDSSSGSAFNAVDRGMISRLPSLPTPITTAWAATGGHILVTTPPVPWQRHELPRAVFDAPETYLLQL
jgi:hypothetical protein